MFLQSLDIGVSDGLGRARELLSKRECRFFLVAEPRSGWVLQVFPIFGSQAGSLRRSDVVLHSIIAAVNHRSADVNEFVKALVEPTAHGRIETDEALENFGAQRKSLVYVDGAADFAIDLFDFRA